MGKAGCGAPPRQAVQAAQTGLSRRSAAARTRISNAKHAQQQCQVCGIVVRTCELIIPYTVLRAEASQVSHSVSGQGRSAAQGSEGQQCACKAPESAPSEGIDVVSATHAPKSDAPIFDSKQASKERDAQPAPPLR